MINKYKTITSKENHVLTIQKVYYIHCTEEESEMLRKENIYKYIHTK